METPQESRRLTVSAACTASEKSAAELAVRIDKLGSVSEALRSHTLSDLIERGMELEAKLATMAAEDSAA
jgi:hypothetical protein